MAAESTRRTGGRPTPRPDPSRRRQAGPSAPRRDPAGGQPDRREPVARKPDPRPTPTVELVQQEPTPALRAAALVIRVQAAALAIGAIVLAVMTLIDNPDRVGRALSIVAFALVGAAVLALGARGIVRLRASARTPITIVELLALPVTYSLGIQAGKYAIGLPIMVSALAVLVLVFTGRSRAALDQNPFDRR